MRNRGYTLIELIVVMAILAVFLGAAIAYVINASRVLSKTRTVGKGLTDIAMASRILQWDVIMAGYGIPTLSFSTYPPVMTADNINSYSDRLTLRGASLATDPRPGAWSIVLYGEGVQDSMVIYRWNHFQRDIQLGDTVMALYPAAGGSIEGGGLHIAIVQDTSSQTWTDPVSGNTWPARLLKLDRSIPVVRGMLVYTVTGTGGGPATAVYELDTNSWTLLRNGRPFLSNTLAFQVQYWLDQNNNGVEDAGEIVNSLAGVSGSEIARFLRKVYVDIAIARTDRKANVSTTTTLNLGNIAFQVPPAFRKSFVEVVHLEIYPRNIHRGG